MSGHTDNEIVINAPYDLVWDVANDIERWPQLFEDEYAAAEILECDDNRIRFRLTTTPLPDGRVYSWVSERVLDRARGTAYARRLETGPFLYMHIFHGFERIEDGTRLRWVQDFEMKPGAPLTTEQMQERIDGTSKVNLRRHKELIETGLAVRS